jgi:hypothetical protein
MSVKQEEDERATALSIVVNGNGTFKTPHVNGHSHIPENNTTNCVLGAFWIYLSVLRPC